MITQSVNQSSERKSKADTIPPNSPAVAVVNAYTFFPLYRCKKRRGHYDCQNALWPCSSYPRPRAPRNADAAIHTREKPVPAAPSRSLTFWPCRRPCAPSSAPSGGPLSSTEPSCTRCSAGGSAAAWSRRGTWRTRPAPASHPRTCTRPLSTKAAEIGRCTAESDRWKRASRLLFCGVHFITKNKCLESSEVLPAVNKLYGDVGFSSRKKRMIYV